MAAINVLQLLEPISAELACGDNLEYDPEFVALERAAETVPARYKGDQMIEPPKEPDWKAVRQKAVDLFGRTKDLRIAMLLTRAAVRIDGLAGFRDAIAILRGLVDRYWKGLYPQLDPDDNFDPSMRINTLLALCDGDACLRALNEAPLVVSPLGKFSYRDYQIVAGELQPQDADKAPKRSAFDAAFRSAEANDIQGRAELVRATIEDVEGLESAVTQAVGVGQAASFDPLVEHLKKIQRVFDDQLGRLGISDGSKPASFPEGAGGEVVAGRGTAGPGTPDAIRSRQDVVRWLDKICDYYREYEPSSPVPVLLARAKRLVSMTFLEILRDLTPSGLLDGEKIAGPQDTPGQSGDAS
jgi:type VI secretion system protein ImpA